MDTIDETDFDALYPNKITPSSIEHMCLDQDRLLHWLRVWRLVPGEDEVYPCPKCEAPLRLYHNVTRCDGWVWQCQKMVSIRRQRKKRCGTTVEFRKGTVFEGTHLSIPEVLQVVYYWVHKITLTNISIFTLISMKTLVDWASFCRGVLLEEFIDRPAILGGPGCVVEIRKSQFGTKKSYKGLPVEGHWVFGGYERDTGNVFMVIVEDCSSNTIDNMMNRWVQPGTTIISNCLNEEVCQHLEDNHPVNVVDSDSESHTGAVESTWRSSCTVKSLADHTKVNIPDDLASYMFRKRCKQLGEFRMVAFLKLAGRQYNPLITPREAHDRDVTDDDEEFSDDKL